MSSPESGLKFRVNMEREKSFEEVITEQNHNIDQQKETNIAGSSMPVIARDKALSDFDRETEREEAVQPSRTPRTVEEYESIKNAKTLMKHREYQLAQRILGQLLAQDSHNVNAILIMGDCHYKMGQIESALNCFEAALDLEESFETLSCIGSLLYDIQDYDLALRYYLQAVQRAETDNLQLFEALKNIGNIYVRYENYEAAEEFYNKAFTLNPSSDVLMINYGTLEIQKRNMDKAVDYFRSAVEVNPVNDKAWVGLALIHREFGDRDLAWGNAERALDINADNETALNLLVEWAMDDGRYWEVIERLQDYLTINDRNSQFSFQLARLLTVVGKFDAASIELERCLTLDPYHEQGHQLSIEIKRIIEEENSSD